ncbi:IS66 family insertion sequence element accessory protein TnpB [Mesorhizobium sp. M2E.F.Ca.ET.219.01.1.1]|uniref:IS66 family insertion sequence element accessory protein TnpB n=1 Tax=Mesorhizobium sp. M2E.F.Ca.ET.219.01.1.1 TaxID=2500530 RepID=UPI000FDC1706|nr:IS66 family insertion sequence element accessory protein TnpB [Mesorhizobium sp. M2E.F.Ca.ET.219.01.1.1]TGQ04469.1 IS66 family insertion sequence element accessory protein TnpB [Mesorhizobium sp. M2E.F.Ca.ET.219.01.1.1]
MFRLGADLKVYLHREPIDFRAGINSLAVLVQETMALDPFAPAVFAFCNRRRERMKLLFFDRSGFVLVLKRLTEDRFRWPRREVPVVTLTIEQLHWILDGIDIDAMAHRAGFELLRSDEHDRHCQPENRCLNASRPTNRQQAA